MVTNRQLRTRKPSGALTSGQIQQLITGHDMFGDGFGYDTGKADRWMRLAWRQNREQVLDHNQEDAARSHWMLYAYLRFDKRMSREDALKARMASYSPGGER
jgi:hypothetical protein